jgi:plasmid stability protein
MAQPKKVAAQFDSLTVRFPTGMLDILRIKAAKNDRSLNAEIVHALRHWIQEASSCPNVPPSTA